MVLYASKQSSMDPPQLKCGILTKLPKVFHCMKLFAMHIYVNRATSHANVARKVRIGWQAMDCPVKSSKFYPMMCAKHGLITANPWIVRAANPRIACTQGSVQSVNCFSRTEPGEAGWSHLVWNQVFFKISLPPLATLQQCSISVLVNVSYAVFT